MTAKKQYKKLKLYTDKGQIIETNDVKRWRAIFKCYYENGLDQV